MYPSYPTQIAHYNTHETIVEKNIINTGIFFWSLTIFFWTLKRVLFNVLNIWCMFVCCLRLGYGRYGAGNGLWRVLVFKLLFNDGLLTFVWFVNLNVNTYEWEFGSSRNYFFISVMRMWIYCSLQELLVTSQRV